MAGRKAMMDYLRKATYELSPTPLASYDYGFEFEEGHRAGYVMAVGIFDSGLGGLTVLSAAQQRLPEVDFIYFGDNVHAPYGVRDADDILSLTPWRSMFVGPEGCDLVILACNTASAAALRRMQEAGVPPGKRVLGMFVPLIEALTERQWLIGEQR